MSTTTTSRFPIEISDQIFSFVHNRFDLLSILRVSRAFHAEAERHLYRTLDFMAPHLSHLASPAFKSMTRNPRLYAHVRTLAVYYEHEFREGLVAALYQMRNLRHLYLEFIGTYRQLRVVWGARAMPQWSAVKQLEKGRGDGEGGDNIDNKVTSPSVPPRMPFQLHSFRTNHCGNSDVADFLLSQTELQRLEWHSANMNPTMMNALHTNLTSSGDSLKAITTLSASNFPILRYVLQQGFRQIVRVELVYPDSIWLRDGWVGGWSMSFPKVRSLKIWHHSVQGSAPLVVLGLKELMSRLLFFEMVIWVMEPECLDTLDWIAEFPCLVKVKLNINLGDRVERVALHLLEIRSTLEEVEIGSGERWFVYRRKPEEFQVSGTNYVGDVEDFGVEQREAQKDADEWLRW